MAAGIEVRHGRVMVDIERIARHARRYGVEGILDASDWERLPARDLGRLCARLRRIRPEFKPPAARRHALAWALLAEGLSLKQVERQALVSRTTLWRLRKSRADPQGGGQEPSGHRGSRVSNQGPKGFPRPSEEGGA